MSSLHNYSNILWNIKKQATSITEFDEALVSRHIAKITVFEDHFTVNFKSGITIDIKA